MGLRRQFRAVPNVAAERQRWALFRNRFAVAPNKVYATHNPDFGSGTASINFWIT